MAVPLMTALPILSWSMYRACRWMNTATREPSVVEEALAISSRVLGDKQPLTIRALNSVGVSNHMTGSLSRAMMIFEEIYDDR